MFCKVLSLLGKMSFFIVLFFAVMTPLVARSSSVPSVFVIDNQAKSRSHTKIPPPIFTHKLHEQRFKCKTCHPDLFIEKIGGNDITMSANIVGKYCGNCHDGMQAPGMAKCDFCHKKTDG